MGQTKKQKIKKSEAQIDKRKLKKEITEKAIHVSENDVKDIVKRENELARKLKKVPGTFSKIINQVFLLLDMIKNYSRGEYKNIPWYTIAMSTAALLYFLNPVDIIPDFIPFLGFVDDAFVIGFVIKAIQKDLKKYCDFKGYSSESFF